MVTTLIPGPVGADGHYTRTDALVAMSDGVRLEASVYVPTGAAPAGGFPLIVRQHGGGSNKDNPYDTGYGIRYVESGRFALLMYSHRGHGASEGFFDFFGPRTTRDFSEMLDWVAASFPAVDATNVGVSGYSQGGGESLLPAAFDRRVRAVGVGNTFANLNQALNPGDCFKFSFATGIFALAYKITASRTHDDLALRWGAQFYTDTEDVGFGPVPSTTEDLDNRSPSTYVDRLNVPVFWTQAWEDQLFPADHPDRILVPLERRGIPVHRWFSSGGHEAAPDHPPDVEVKELAMREWFEEFLAGIEHGFASGARPPVDWWTRTAPDDDAVWVHRQGTDWPLPGTETTSLWPTFGGELGREPGQRGDLATVVNDLATANTATDPILGRRAAPLSQLPPDGANPLDTARFTSEPLAQPVEITGTPSVHVRIRTTALRVVQLNAKLWDVSDAGARMVTRGCVSGAPSAAVDLDLWPTSHRFEAGHRIALTLGPVDFPTFKPDTEPHATTILAGTRVDLPVYPTG